MSRAKKPKYEPVHYTAEDYLDAYPEIPTIDGVPPVVDYSERGPRDFVISGKLGSSNAGFIRASRGGRTFKSPNDALRWATHSYPPGYRLRLLKPPSSTLDLELSELEDSGWTHRWAILVTPVD